MSSPVLSSLSVTLRPPCQADAAKRLAWGRPAEITRMYGFDPETSPPLTEEACQQFIVGISESPCAWVIDREAEMVGYLILRAFDAQDRRATLGVGLFHPSVVGRGIGRQAIRLAMRYAFDELKLHRIALRVGSYNPRAIRCYQACGFVEEGRERESSLLSGRWHDDIIMGVLDREARYAD